MAGREQLGIAGREAERARERGLRAGAGTRALAEEAQLQVRPVEASTRAVWGSLTSAPSRRRSSASNRAWRAGAAASAAARAVGDR